MINAEADLWFDIEGLDLVDDDGHPCKDGRLPKYSVNVMVDLKVEDVMKEWNYQLHDKLLMVVNERLGLRLHQPDIKKRGSSLWI